jgi:membrane-associated protein
MDLDLLVRMGEQYGYAALFFSLWLGIVGMPIPDELIVMSGGMMTAVGWLQPIPAFLLTYLGVVSGLTLGYVLGYKWGAPLLERLAAKYNGLAYLERARRLLERWGSWALCFSYFFPVVRHLVPYLVGIQRMPAKRYALYSLPAGFVWTLHYFLIGRFFGRHVEAIAEAVHSFGLITLCILVCATVSYGLIRLRWGQTKAMGGENGGKAHDPGGR